MFYKLHNISCLIFIEAKFFNLFTQTILHLKFAFYDLFNLLNRINLGFKKQSYSSKMKFYPFIVQL